MSNTNFDPKTLAIELDDGQLYLPVSGRVTWFRHEWPKGKIIPKIIKWTEHSCIVQADVYLDVNDQFPIASNFASRNYEPDEILSKFVENATTAAIGRALATAGYNMGFLDEDEDSIVDAPIENKKRVESAEKIEVNPESAIASVASAQSGCKLPPAEAVAADEEVKMTTSLTQEEESGTFEIPEAFREAQKTDVTGQMTPNLPEQPAKKKNDAVPKKEITLQSATATVFDFGKYKGKTVGQVAMEDAEYLEWFSTKEFAGKSDLKEAICFVLTNAAGIPLPL